MYWPNGPPNGRSDSAQWATQWSTQVAEDIPKSPPMRTTIGRDAAPNGGPNGCCQTPNGVPIGVASLTMKHPMEGPSSQWGAQWVVVGSHWAFQSAKMPPNGTRHGPNTVDHSPGHWHWHYGVQCPRLRLLIPCNHPQLSKTPSCSCSVYTQAEVHAVPPAAGTAKPPWCQDRCGY